MDFTHWPREVFTLDKNDPDIRIHEQGRIRLLCPLEGCDWSHVEIVIIPSEDSLADIFGKGQMKLSAQNQLNCNVDRAVNNHLASHERLEIVSELLRVRELLSPFGIQDQEMTMEASIERVDKEMQRIKSHFGHAEVMQALLKRVLE